MNLRKNFKSLNRTVSQVYTYNLKCIQNIFKKMYFKIVLLLLNKTKSDLLDTSRTLKILI